MQQQIKLLSKQRLKEEWSFIQNVSKADATSQGSLLYIGFVVMIVPTNMHSMKMPWMTKPKVYVNKTL